MMGDNVHTKDKKEISGGKCMQCICGQISLKFTGNSGQKWYN